MERATKISLLLFLVLGLGLIFVGNQVNTLQKEVNSLDGTIIKAGITIDNGTDTTTETVTLTRGATALEGLQRIATIETKTYSWGTYLVSVNGVEENLAANKSWIYYKLENKNDWKQLEIGADTYELEDEDNIRFSYEKVSW